MCTFSDGCSGTVCAVVGEGREPNATTALLLVVLVVALVERWTRDRKVAGSTPGWGAIKSTRSTQPSIPPG